MLHLGGQTAELPDELCASASQQAALRAGSGGPTSTQSAQLWCRHLSCSPTREPVWHPFGWLQHPSGTSPMQPTLTCVDASEQGCAAAYIPGAAAAGAACVRPAAAAPVM